MGCQSQHEGLPELTPNWLWLRARICSLGTSTGQLGYCEWNMTRVRHQGWYLKLFWKEWKTMWSLCSDTWRRGEGEDYTKSHLNSIQYGRQKSKREGSEISVKDWRRRANPEWGYWNKEDRGEKDRTNKHGKEEGGSKEEGRKERRKKGGREGGRKKSREGEKERGRKREGRGEGREGRRKERMKGGKMERREGEKRKGKKERGREVSQLKWEKRKKSARGGWEKSLERKKRSGEPWGQDSGQLKMCQDLFSSRNFLL